MSDNTEENLNYQNEFYQISQTRCSCLGSAFWKFSIL